MPSMPETVSRSNNQKQEHIDEADAAAEGAEKSRGSGESEEQWGDETRMFVDAAI